MPRQTRLSGMVLLIAAALLLDAVAASASSPSLSLILPRGCQRGAETTLSFRGARLDGAEEIFFYTPGFEVTDLKVVNDKRVDVNVKVPADCRLGEHVAQVRTTSGISEYRTFYVGPFAAIDEKEPNSSFDSPQEIDFNVTVEGVIQNEDVDYFAVDAKKGQRIVAEVEGLRLAATLFDPYVAILDSERFELSAEDDTTLLKQDAAAAIVAPEDGRYVIELRDSSYGGNGASRYRLHVGTFPRPTAVYPAGGKVGEEMEVRFLGDAAGDFTQRVKLPNQIVENFGLEPKQDGQVAPSPNPFRLFAHGNVLEVEPNNSLKEATPAELPLAFNGIIETEGDRDYFRFTAKKGQVYEVECYARRIRSPLDPVMYLYHADGKRVEANDDSRGPDSYFRFSVPKDGEYVVGVRDHLDRGGAEFVYRIELTPREPSLTLSIPKVARYSQYRQWIAVARGNRFGTLMTARRSNFGGDLVLADNDLPPGVSVVAEPMPGNMNLMPVVFEAADDAPIGGNLVDFQARLDDDKRKIVGSYRNTGDFIRGRPGNSIYWTVDVDRLPVVVVEELPFELEIVQPKVPIVQNGSMQLKVVAHRQEGFDAEIRVQFPFRPPGIGAASSVKIPKGKNEVLYPLNANGNARIGKWPVYALGSASVNGNAWVSSQMATLEIAAPYVDVAMDRAAVEQGQQTNIICKLTHNRPFEGKAKIKLTGVPHKVTVPELEFTKDTEELIFPVQTDAASPAGRHKNVFCQVVVTEHDEPIVHRVGKTELRIDKPLPPKSGEPKKAEAVAQKDKPKPKAPPKKPLSRLEQLRLEAKQKAEAAAGTK